MHPYKFTPEMWLPILISFLASWFCIVLILRSRLARELADVPNARSLHTRVTPRVGGLGIMFGVLMGWLYSGEGLWFVLVPLVLLFGVSVLDDKHNLPVRWRFLMHFLAAAGVLLSMTWPHSWQSLVLVPVLLLTIVWMTNLYNFMDGSDGLAGGMAMIGFGSYGVAAWSAGESSFAMVNLCIAAAALGFLIYNFHPAKVFMGDAGSIPLGFLSAALGIWGWTKSIWPAWFPLLVFSPFIVDATLTLIKRFVRGDKVTQAHREHYYQRAIQMGLGHRNLALLEYALMVLAGVTGVLCLEYEWPWALLIAWVAIYAILIKFIDARWARLSQDK